jgi:hypothetical protein
MNKAEYLEVASRRKGTDSAVFDLPMPSGAVWKVLPIKLDQYITSGRLPLHLIQHLGSVKNIEAKAAEFAEKLSGADIVNMYTIVRDAMLFNVVEPKISLTETDEALTPEQILPEDFEFFRDFVFSGGQAGRNSFRKPSDTERTGPADTHTDSSPAFSGSVSDLTN